MIVTNIPDFWFEVQGKRVNCLFNTMALRLYCEHKKVEKDDFYVQILKAWTKEEDFSEEMKAVKDLVYTDLRDLLYFGHESWCAYNGQPFNANEMTKDLWIDSIGGVAKQKETFAQILYVIMQKSISEGEKKSQVIATKTVNGSESGLHGETSNYEELRQG